jgi:uncharacterized protein YdhG (YjbR/CyaY superfamily)
MADTPKTIDEYLASVPDDKREALERLRKIITNTVPDAQECISYQMPAFRLHGRMLLGFAAAKNHCSLYPWSASAITAFADELTDFSTSKGTVRFQPDKPIPEELIRKIIDYRISENDSKGRK